MNVLKICAKCNDSFNARLEVDGKDILEYEGYVPEFMPEEHYGDYVELDIDLASGQILNWNKVTLSEAKKQEINNY